MNDTATEERRNVMGEDVRRGLSSTPKSLPAYLFYDDEGSRLYEQITELDEYYPTRTERAILARHSADIVRRVRLDATEPLRIVELGAGTATKTTLLLEAVVAEQGECVFLPVDVSGAALDEATERLSRELPAVDVRPFVGRHEAAFATIRSLGPRRLVLFIGSSIGNFDDAAALALLRGVRESLAPGGALLLGTDLRKDPARLVAAYDDSRGVTAAFNLNILRHINRELGAGFEPERFRHVAVWNDDASRMEMHLESREAQEVFIESIGLVVKLGAGERIHTESSVKYDLPRIDALLGAAGFERETTYTDDEKLFAVHLARVV